MGTTYNKGPKLWNILEADEEPLATYLRTPLSEPTTGMELSVEAEDPRTRTALSIEGHLVS